MPERIRIHGTLTFRDDESVADARALIELEADREDGVPELARWVSFDGRRARFRGSAASSYAGWRALQRAVREVAEYAEGGRVDLDHDLAGRVPIHARPQRREWIEDFAKVLEHIKRAFGGARFDDRAVRIHLERSSGRVTVPTRDTTALVVAWSQAFAPGEEVLFVRNRFSKVDPKMEGHGVVHHVARVLVNPVGGGAMRTPVRVDRGALRALDPKSELLERSTSHSAFAAAYFLDRGVAYELRHDEVEVITADADDPLLVALR